ncbi:MAG: hypothetical protein ABII39_00005, partial [Candidatus Micrarchaeota archaeon]
MREGTKRRLAAAVLTVAVYVGTYCAMIPRPFTCNGQTEPLVSQSMHDEDRSSPENQARQVKQLIEERDQFIRKNISSLQKGEKIKLSDFLIEGSVLDMNISRAEKGEPFIRLESMKREYEKIVGDAKTHLMQEPGIFGLFEFYHTKVLGNYYFPCDSMAHVLKNGCFNCTSTTEMFTALMEDVLSFRPKIVVFGDHLRSYVDGRKIENTEHNWEKAGVDDDECGVNMPRNVIIAAYLLGHGVNENEIPQDLMEYYLKRNPRPDCRRTKKDTPEDTQKLAAKGMRFPDPGEYSGLTIPDYPVPNDRKVLTNNDVTKLARAYLAAYRLSHLGDPAEGMANEVDLSKGIFASRTLAPGISIPHDADWGGLYEMLSGNFILPSRMYRWTNGPPFFIESKAIPILAELAVQQGNEMAALYTRKGICTRYKTAVENRWIEWLDSFAAADFCPELEEPLKALYTDTGDITALHGLGAVAPDGGFDFFGPDIIRGRKIGRYEVRNMVMSDWQRTCTVLDSLDIEQRSNLEAIQSAVCSDEKRLWKMLETETDENIVMFALIYFKTKELNKRQKTILINIGNGENLTNKILVAKAFFRSGDRQTAMGYIHEAENSKKFGSDEASRIVET